MDDISKRENKERVDYLISEAGDTPGIGTVIKESPGGNGNPDEVKKVLLAPEDTTQIESDNEEPYNIPSLQGLPEPARLIAQGDLDTTTDYINRLDAFTSQNHNNPNGYFQASSVLEDAMRYWNCSTVGGSRREERHSVYQKPYISGISNLYLQNSAVWGTKELQQLLIRARTKSKKVAIKAKKVFEESEFWKNSANEFDRIINMAPFKDKSVIEWEKVNEEVADIDNTDMLVYHGTYQEAFLDMLEANALLSRKKQQEQLGRNRFSTPEFKRTNQEMEQIAFSVNKANWGYTREGQDPRFLGPPNYLWVVADGGWLMKNQHDRFLYTDGVHFFGPNVQDGFQLPFADSPMCFMMTQEAKDSLIRRVQKDGRFDEKTLALIEEKSVIIPRQQIPDEKTAFTLSEEVLTDIKERIKHTSASYEVQKREGYIVPSGEIGEDNSGEKVMTYCWMDKPAETEVPVK